MDSNKNINPFEKTSGSVLIAQPRGLFLLFVTISVFALILSKLEIIGAGMLFALFFLAVYLYFIFKYPIIGFYTAIALNFTLIGVGRYVKGLPLGFGIDGILILTYIALFFNRFKERINWSPANRDVTILASIWFGYSLFQIINPEARSMAAWVSGRGIGLYPFLFIPLTLLFINTNKRLDAFLYVWGVFSILATIKGSIQLFFGVDAAEQAWLDGGGAETHVLFGKLRIFSFFSDAGQFGANQGYTGVVAGIYAMSKKGKAKLFFIIVSLLGFYGMMISGTRGSISVPVMGMLTYFVLSKNIKVLSAGLIFLVLVFVFFKYTTIANGNYQIRRMRSAFDPNNKSLQVRLDNQKILKGYLASRPFGGGIGHGGVKAQRFLPHAFLSQVATDSWYVLIWVEQGIIGLTLHLLILFYIAGKAAYKVMFRIGDPITKLKVGALIAGMMGVMAASYGNAILGGMPTALLIYASMAIMSNPEIFERPKENLEAMSVKP